VVAGYYNFYYGVPNSVICYSHGVRPAYAYYYYYYDGRGSMVRGFTIVTTGVIPFGREVSEHHRAVGYTFAKPVRQACL
jgi:hypothetical protein